MIADGRNWRRCVAGALAGLLFPAVPARAIEIRNYEPARHDRFTGGFENLSWNETAWFNSRLYSGVGWSAQEVENKQFALVSPMHVVCAAHFLPALGSGIRFLGQDGNLVQRAVALQQVVPNGSGGSADLALITLSAPISPEDGVTHFPYLNLATEADYVGNNLVAFGRIRKAGRGVVASFGNYSNDDIGETRVMRFNYLKVTGHQDDAYLIVGDSGSPTFVMAGSRPALIGTHTAVEETVINRVNIDTFVPAYIAELDEFMAPAGYRMTPAYLPPVELAATVEATPSKLWQAEPGSLRFELKNPSADDAGNVRLELSFAAGQAPDSVTAPDWVPENAGPLIWSFRRASLEAGGTASVTAAWNALPIEPLLVVELEHNSDGGPARSEVFQLPLQAGYAAWSDGLADPAQDADPDMDSVVNLLEYAFGGDPIDGGSVAAGGVIFQVRVENGEAALEFPVRTDAGARGLSYQIEISESLETGSWGVVPPEDLTVTQSSLTPSVPGFSLRRATHATSGERAFYRVRVTLAE